MVDNYASSNLIREGKSIQIPSLLQSGRSQGMHTLNDDLALLVRTGKVTKQEALNVAADPIALGKSLEGVR